jgi:hypothetical protein
MPHITLEYLTKPFVMEWQAQRLAIQLTGDHILNACRRVNYASSMRHGTAYDEEVGDFSAPSATSPTYRSFAKE